MPAPPTILPAPVEPVALPAHAMACPQCGLHVELPALERGEEATCPRCDEHLVSIPHSPIDEPLAMAWTSLILLLLACSFPLLAIDVQGNQTQITLLESAETIYRRDFALLANVLLLCVLLLPAIFLLSTIYLFSGIRTGRRLPWMKPLGRLSVAIQPWMMVDVFLLGAIVSMIKMASLAQVGFGLSFWALLGFSLALTRTGSLVEAHWLHYRINLLQGIDPTQRPAEPCHGCRVCGFFSPASAGHCQYCHATLHARHPHSLQKTVALLATAIVLYLPANLYPIMLTESLGRTTPSTIVEGIFLLWEKGSYPIAIIIFAASVFIPIVKMIALAALCLAASRPHRTRPLHLTRLYRIVDFIGRWSMVDVFVVIILVTLVRMGSLMSVHPGVAAVSFCGVVLATMLSAMSFDVRMLWDVQHPVSTGREHDEFD